MQLKWCITFILSLCIFFCAPIEAQNKTQIFNFETIKEGISKVGIYTIIQDNYGFIWIGTNGAGLYKFDGLDYTSYKFKQEDATSISSDLVFSSYLDKNNNLWIGTEDGLNLYDRDLDQFKKISVGLLENANISVLSILECRGNLYIGTRLNGLFKLNLKTNKIQRIACKPAINSIQKDKNGTIFLGTSLGLRKLDTLNSVILKPKEIEGATIFNFDIPIQTLLVDTNNNLWAGSYTKGVFKYQLKDNNIVSFSQFSITEKRILSLVELADKTFLFGSENDGLFHMDSNGVFTKNYRYNKKDKNSIRSNSIWSLFVDNNERIWMGYYNSGVVVSDHLFDKFDNIESVENNPNSLQIGSVTGIVKDANDKLWITMDGGGIDVFDIKTSKVDHINTSNDKTYSGLTSNHIQTIFIDSKKNIWAGSWDNGIYVLKDGFKNITNINIENSNGKLLSNAILSFAEDKDGIIWIGTFYAGVCSFNPKTHVLTHHNSQEFAKYGINTSDVRKILVDSDGAIWLGTTIGLFKINNNQGVLSVKSFVKPMANSNNNQRSSTHILSLYESTDNYLWIGTRGAGLCRYDKKTDEFKWFNKFSGLNEENIASIIEDKEGDIWVSGNSGITKLDLKTNEVVNYTMNDGLLSDDFNFNAVLKDEEGKLYFGNYKGVDFFNPKDLSTNSSVPSLYLTGLKIFNKDVVPNEENSPLTKTITETPSIEFNHKQSVFTIQYTGINYTRPEKNQYAYYLEGLEKSWNYVGNQRSATYTNLDYGDYIFKLKAANNDGLWNEKPLELKITILPPWWKSNLALIIYVLLFGLGVYLLNKITQNRLKEKELIKNERTQRLQQEDLNKKKLQFFTNISHEFRTPLTLILNPLKDMMRDETLNLPEKVKSKHSTIYRNSDRLFRLINELMDLRKLEFDKLKVRASELNLVDFTKNIVLFFKEEAANRNIFLTLDTEMSLIKTWADQNMLEKIIFNILSNAMKVTPDNGVINVNLIDNDEDYILPLISSTKAVKVVEIVISDTGKGLEEDQVDKIFERFYQVESLNKTYYGGTGIGLEVVSSFVNLHKGKIEVTSKINEGTTFRIILPKGKEYFSADEIKSFKLEADLPKKEINFIPENKISEIEENEEIEKIASKKYTILVVEDNTELRNYLKTELSKTYKVLSAINGVEGLKIAEKSFPDVILTDVIMPEMDGFEFCRRIKTDIKTSHIPLLMLTAKARIDDRIEGIEHGSDAYMTKPFDMRLLTLRLNQLITSRKLIFDKYFSEVSGAKENTNATSIDKEFINKVLAYIGENISNSSLSVEELANELNLSKSQSYRKIKSLTGQTPNELLRRIRLERAYQILETGSAFISEVGFKVGFSSASYFTKCFKAHFGKLPTEVVIKEK
ncbi:hybrid sensor histidine kinase/response regulator [Polaribacter sejongensis]|uniref:histidine kinase n=1 Tax=Polaribacter sejongensis TaxID=985043 RepID=A0ABM6PWZ1_9FLAO|nr:hybrid sensor histidine kinase/response regulator transcription factor [Polaribacter sejongensis]AUC21170.1 hybrid sensor histidine kinase/response regulator [Polaribacter sejongensis]